MVAVMIKRYKQAIKNTIPRYWSIRIRTISAWKSNQRPEIFAICRYFEGLSGNRIVGTYGPRQKPLPLFGCHCKSKLTKGYRFYYCSLHGIGTENCVTGSVIISN